MFNNKLIDIPETLKVGGIRYKVENVSGIVDRFETLGQVNYLKGTIQVDDSLCTDKRNQVIVHELTHAIFMEAGFEEQDEDMINRIGNVLFQVLSDNKF